MPLFRPRGPLLSALLLASIVALAIALRVVFFVGLVSGDPQDDGIYYHQAFALYEHGPTSLARYRPLPPDYLANPIDQFHVRPLVTYPIAATFLAFGPGEWQATLWAGLCSIASVLVVYRLGAVMYGSAVGLVAALLCAFYPLEVVNGTRILGDVQLGLCTSLGLLCLVEGERRSRPLFPLLAGVAAGAAYLANVRGLLILAVFVGVATVGALRRRTDWRAPLLVVTGFAAVFSVQAIVYGVTAGDPFLSYRIQNGAARFKYLFEPVSVAQWPWLRVEYTNGVPFELLRSVFVGDNRPTDHFGFFFFLFAAAMLYSVVRRRNLLLAALAVGLFLYFELGPLFLSIDWTRGVLRYQMVFKQERFLLMLSAPLLVTAAQALVGLGSRSRAAALALLLVLFVTSLVAIEQTRDFYRAGLASLRAVTPHVLRLGDRPVFSDTWAVEHLQIFTGHRARNLRMLGPDSRPSDVNGGCVLLGGLRGAELDDRYVSAALPPFARDVRVTGVAPANWTPLVEIEEPSGGRLRLYCVD